MRNYVAQKIVLRGSRGTRDIQIESLDEDHHIEYLERRDERVRKADIARQALIILNVDLSEAHTKSVLRDYEDGVHVHDT